jgi:hypothetical protein
MQMIDVLKRLAELDSTNPNVAKPAMTQEQSLATVTNIEGETITESIAECGPMGMMGGLDRPTTPATFSINASAESGAEVSSMLRDIMNLAGVKPVADLPAFADPMASKEIELEPAHAAEPVDDMANMIGMIDKLNGPSDGEMDIDGAGIGGNELGASPVADMADDVRDMADEMAGADPAGFGDTDTTANPQVKADDAGDSKVTIGKAESDPVTGLGNNNLKKTEGQFESLAAKLLQDYQQFVSESNK